VRLRPEGGLTRRRRKRILRAPPGGKRNDDVWVAWTMCPLDQTAFIERKFTNFAVPVVGKAGAERVLSIVDSLEELKDVRELTQVLRGSGKQNPV
jgi:hypothetical protein